MENQKKTNELMTVQEVSDFLRLPLSTVYYLVSEGKICGVRFGRHWRFQRKDILAYLSGDSRDRAPHSSYQERRQVPRLKTEIAASVGGLLSATSHIQLKGQIRNLSEGGAFIQLSKDIDGRDFENLEEGDPVEVEFRLPESEQIMDVRARIVRVAQGSSQGFGIKFRSLLERKKEKIRKYVG